MVDNTERWQDSRLLVRVLGVLTLMAGIIIPLVLNKFKAVYVALGSGVRGGVVTEAAVCVFGAACIVIGVGLLGLRWWAHRAFVVLIRFWLALGSWIIVVMLTTGFDLPESLITAVWMLLPAIGIALIVFLIPHLLLLRYLTRSTVVAQFHRQTMAP